jgi:hypothetical protein
MPRGRLICTATVLDHVRVRGSPPQCPLCLNICRYVVPDTGPQSSIVAQQPQIKQRAKSRCDNLNLNYGRVKSRKCLQSETLGPFPKILFLSNGRPVRNHQLTFHEVANPQQATSVAHRIVPTPVPTPSVAKKSEFFHGSGITFFSTESI